MGAQHGMVQPPIPEQLQDLVETGIDAERSDWFDRQETVTRERLHGLLAPHGRAAQDPVDRVVLHAHHEPLGLAGPGE
jgi:hypothetical protein